MAPERNLGSERTKAALVKYEAPSMTSDLLAGRKAQENQWVKDTQNFLAIETLLYIYGLQAMKSHERNQVTLEHFENLVQMVKPPAGTEFRVAKLLVPFASKDGEVKLTGEKVWNKAQVIKRDMKADLYAGIWSRLCPGNRLPSGKTVKDIFTQWWHCHYNVHSKKMKLTDINASSNPGRAPVDWIGPPYALMFEHLGLPAKHHPNTEWWSFAERTLFDVSDGVTELTQVESKQASREKQRSDKQQKNGFVSLERASRAAEVTADMTRARAEVTYATSQLHTAHMAAWREKIAALEQARRVCMEDAKLAAELGDPDFDPRALKVQALKLGAQLRFLSANPPAPTAPSSSSTAPSFTSPSWSPRSSTSTSTHTTARTHMTPRTSRSPRRPLPPGTPDEHESDVEWSQDGQNDAREDTPPASPAAAPTDEPTREHDTARCLWEMSNSPPPGSPQTAELPTHADSFFAVSPTRASSPPPPQPAAVRRSPRHTPAKYALFAHTATEHPIAHWSVWRPTLGIQALLVLHQHVYFHQHQGWGSRDSWNVVAPMWGTPLSCAFADHSAMP